MTTPPTDRPQTDAPDALGLALRLWLNHMTSRHVSGLHKHMLDQQRRMVGLLADIGASVTPPAGSAPPGATAGPAPEEGTVPPPRFERVAQFWDAIQNACKEARGACEGAAPPAPAPEDPKMNPPFDCTAKCWPTAQGGGSRTDDECAQQVPSAIRSLEKIVNMQAFVGEQKAKADAVEHGGAAPGDSHSIYGPGPALTFARVMQRLVVERQYQRRRWGTRVKSPHKGGPDVFVDDRKSIGDFIVYMDHHLTEAKRLLTTMPGNTEALTALRKVTALGVALCEMHGVPERDPNVPVTNEHDRRPA